MALLASVPPERRSQCWWIVLPDGTPVAGDVGGGVTLFTVLSATRPLGRFLGALRLSPVVDGLDRVLSRARKHLSRLVPDGPAPRRFP